jgi:hypothetical protein
MQIQILLELRKRVDGEGHHLTPEDHARLGNDIRRAIALGRGGNARDAGHGGIQECAWGGASRHVILHA